MRFVDLRLMSSSSNGYERRHSVGLRVVLPFMTRYAATYLVVIYRENQPRFIVSVKLTDMKFFKVSITSQTPGHLRYSFSVTSKLAVIIAWNLPSIIYYSCDYFPRCRIYLSISWYHIDVNKFIRRRHVLPYTKHRSEAGSSSVFTDGLSNQMTKRYLFCSMI